MVFKINKKIAILFFCLLFLVFISGCSECKEDSDCPAKRGFSVVCEDSKCAYGAVEEAAADTSVKFDCACALPDYNICKGKVKLPARAGQTVDAAYLNKCCNMANQCISAVEESDVKEVTLIDEKIFPLFTLEIKPTFNRPFDIDKGQIKFDLKLKNADEEGIKYPIIITNIQISGGEVFFGETPLVEGFEGIGDSFVAQLPLSYQPVKPEEEHSLAYKIDYEYTKRIKEGMGNATSYREELARGSYQNKFTSKLFLVKTGEMV